MMKRLIYVFLTAVLLMSNVPTYGENIGEKSNEAGLIEDMILYYGGYGEEASEKIGGLLDTLNEADSSQGELWEDIMDYWKYANTDLVINSESLPDNLPKDDSLAIVILGYVLNDDGSMRDELIGRLQVGLDCAKQYPNAYVVCTGGGTAKENKEVTEAGQMGAWLLENGLEENRLILEDRSRTTIENAQFTLDILLTDYPQVDSVAIVSNDYHVARGCLLFETTALMIADEKQEPDVQVVSNCASATPDKTYTDEYLRRWQMYNMLQLIGDQELAQQYIKDSDNFPWPALDDQSGVSEAA